MGQRVAVGADHGGYPLKTTVIEFARAQGYEVLDLGTNSPEAVDYPDYALSVGKAVTCSAGAALGLQLLATRLSVFAQVSVMTHFPLTRGARMTT